MALKAGLSAILKDNIISLELREWLTCLQVMVKEEVRADEQQRRDIKLAVFLSSLLIKNTRLMVLSQRRILSKRLSSREVIKLPNKL